MEVQRGVAGSPRLDHHVLVVGAAPGSRRRLVEVGHCGVLQVVEGVEGGFRSGVAVLAGCQVAVAVTAEG